MNKNERRWMTDAKERGGYPVNVSEAPMRVAVYLRVATMGQVPIRTEDLIRSYVDKIQRRRTGPLQVHLSMMRAKSGTGKSIQSWEK